MQSIDFSNPRYQVLGALGQGGMGIVHRATDRLTGETVALKQVTNAPKLHISNTAYAAQTAGSLRLALAREFQTLAGLRHPNIISVLDYGFDAEQKPFYTMNYLPNAQTLLKAGEALPFEKKTELLEQVLQALAYLHRRGVLHRDLKPENVLVSAGVVKVLDFGLAASHSGGVSSEGGTAFYTAPEVWEGQPYSTAADLYAVGVMMCELFTGRHPFGPLDHALIDRVLDEDPNLDGVEPKLAAVLHQLLAKDPAQRFQQSEAVLAAVAEVAGLPVPEESVAIRESFLQAATFVGREAELNSLTAALEQSKLGQSSAWLIGGESGVGKSRLLNEIRTQALVNGFQVLRGQAVEGGGLPYQLWREPMRHILLSTNVSSLEAGVLHEIVPDIGDLLGQPIMVAPTLEGKAKLERLNLTIVDVLQRQTQPTLLLLEDLHWTHESLEPVRLLARIINAPIVIIGTYRSDEQPTLPETLPPQFRLIPLARLHSENIAALTISMLGISGNRPEMVELLQRETEGNTFFLVEVIRALAEEAGNLEKIGQMTLPRSVLAGGVQNIIRRRLNKMPAWGQALLQIAAVSGRELDLAVLTTAIHADNTLLPDNSLENWLSVGAEAAILTVANNMWQFAHDKLRISLLADLDSSELGQAHGIIARAIETTYPDDKARLAILFEHWYANGDREQSLRYAQLSAEQLIGTSAYQDALQITEKGLAFIAPQVEHPARLWLLKLQGEIWAALGDYTKARDAYATSLDLARQNQVPTAVVDNLLGLAGIQHTQGEITMARLAYEEAFSIAQNLNDRNKIARALLGLANFYRDADYPLARDYFEKALVLSEAQHQTESMAACHFGLGVVVGAMGEVSAALNHLHRAKDLFQQIGSRSGLFSCLNTIANYITATQPAEAEKLQQEALRIAREIGHRKNIGIVLNNLANRLMDAGRYQETLAYQQEALQIYTELKAQVNIGAILCNIGLARTELGQFATAQASLEQGLDILRQLDAPRYTVFALHTLATVHRKQGQLQDALPLAKEALTLARKVGESYFVATALIELAAIETELGKFTSAYVRAKESQQIIEENNSIVEKGFLLTVFGRWAYAQGRFDEAKQHHLACLALARENSHQINIAESLAHLAFLMPNAQPETIRQILREGFEVTKQIGSQHILMHLLAGMAWLLSESGSPSQGAKIYGFIKDCPSTEGFVKEHRLPSLYARLQARLTPENLELVIQQSAKQTISEALAIADTELADTHGVWVVSTESPKTEQKPTSGSTPELTSEPKAHEKLSGEALLARLLTISRHMAETRTLAPLLTYVVDQALELVGAERGYIVLLKEDASLDYRVQRRADGTNLTPGVDPISHSVLEEAIKSQKSVLVRNALMDPRFGAALSVMVMQLRSIMCVPLITKNKVIGALYVENRSQASRFSEADLTPLEFFSNEAAVAIENAFLNDNLENLVLERTRELAQAKEVAEAANQAKTHFLSNMSHELRTPLNAILNFTGFVHDEFFGEVNQEQKDALQQSLDSAEHLLSLINDILDLNKIEAGMINLILEKVDLGKLLQHMHSTAKGLIKDKPLALYMEIPEELPLVMADKRRARQILLNILSNAVKYTLEGSITVRAEVLPDWVQISVQDTGIGIPEKDQPFVFETYRQASNNLENVVSTGLGLPITKHLVELHQGRIWFESQTGVGSTFFVQLPLNPAGVP